MLAILMRAGIEYAYAYKLLMDSGPVVFYEVSSEDISFL